MYDPDSSTNILNYPTPNFGVWEFAFIWLLILFGFFVMFFMFPAFSMWLFSVRQITTQEETEEMEPVPQTHSSSEYGYGYGKYRCVDDEAVYDEVVYEAEPPVKRAAKPPVKPPVKTTDSKVIEEAIGGMHYLGFKKTEAKKAVNRVCNGRIFTSAEELIKATLDRSNV